MKFILATLLSLSVAHAENRPTSGIFQLSADHSKMTLFEKNLEMTGVLILKDIFQESKLTVETPEAKFVSTEFRGDLNGFEVKGHLYYLGKKKIVTLKSRFVGLVNQEFGKIRAAFNVSNETLGLRIFATKHSPTTTALIKEVNDIIR